ncbi:uncharacterized protein TM35_000761080 [Trypanosoma theileri]|uniref:Uncharacterized protein n=1 Tax=Trypanosoma theileri TaxID=67003 RepID=A0A1X0NF20_9TRYP|nr:uncharacterized protein TM35_000761080 [Trypanosoma theileri]ORC83163.1 hypothetical protein TM35_000761080 [Trypanosoma theileri]
MVLRRLLCFFALLLSVPSLCTSASGAAAAAEALPPESRCTSAPSGDSRPDSDCPSSSGVHPPGSSGSCPTGTQHCPAPDAAAAAAAASKTATGSCPDTGSTGADTGDTCTSPAQDASGGSNGGRDRSTAREHDLTGKAGQASSGEGAAAGERGEQGPAGAGATTCPDGDADNPNCSKDTTLPKGPVKAEGHAEALQGQDAARGVGAPSIGSAGEAGRAGAPTQEEIPDPRGEQEAAAPTDPATRPETPASAPDTGIRSNNEGSESETSQPPSSPNGTAPAGDAGSNPASNEDGTSEGTEATSNIESAENTDTTTTTTTTTTLPPELTNNKKGDADNSSSISSVWVRVPLLIVVTLACILVC